MFLFCATLLAVSGLTLLRQRYHDPSESFVGRGQDQARPLSEDAGNTETRMGVCVLL